MSFKKIKLDDKMDDSDVFLSTEIEEETFSIDYEIKNFPDFDKKILSPIFVGGPKSQHKWRLQVNPKYKDEDDDDNDGDGTEYVSIFLHLVKQSGDPNKTVRAKYQICLINSERKVINTIDAMNHFSTGQGWGWKKFIPKSDVLDLNNGYLVDGNILKILCQVSVTLGPKSSNFLNINSNLNPQPTAESCSEKMSSFLDAGTFADFTVQTNTSSFPVSKIILAGRSDVFNSMFNSGMRESKENIIKIEDLSDDSIKGMLKFLYTGDINLTDKNAGELLAISDKYQVLDMKYKCEGFLLKNLKIENAAEILIMAHFHSPKSLKPKVISFLNRYKQQVELTDGFKQMESTHPIIVTDLYKSIN